VAVADCGGPLKLGVGRVDHRTPFARKNDETTLDRAVGE